MVRAGFGISYTPFEDNTYAYNFPVRSNNSYQQNNSYQPAVLGDGVTPATFQAGFPAPVPFTVPDNGLVPANTSFLLNQAYVVIPKNYQNPYIAKALEGGCARIVFVPCTLVRTWGTRREECQPRNTDPCLGRGHIHQTVGFPLQPRPDDSLFVAQVP